MISDEAGTILSLVMANNEEDKDVLHLIQKKFTKNFGEESMLKCLPVMWHEIVRVKSRVESVLNHLTNKTVTAEKVLEFKK